jgi:hypothetical protein
MSRWINYKMDSKFQEYPFLTPKLIGGKGGIRQGDKNVYLGGSYIGQAPFNTHAIGRGIMPISYSPLQPPKSRYNSSRLAKDGVFFN